MLLTRYNGDTLELFNPYVIYTFNISVLKHILETRDVYIITRLRPFESETLLQIRANTNQEHRLILEMWYLHLL